MAELSRATAGSDSGGFFENLILGQQKKLDSKLFYYTPDTVSNPGEAWHNNDPERVCDLFKNLL